MCMAYEAKCTCGARSVSFHFKDNIMPEQVIKGLYCPSCSTGVTLDPLTMISDNGWVIRYDMEAARFMGEKHIKGEITPSLLLEQGYCSWNGVYPGDNIDSVREREKIIALAKTDPKEYFKKLKSWAVERMEKLKNEGWRKAQNAS
jgi:hypothetical protein